MTVLAEFTFGHAILTVLSVAVFVAWLMLLFTLVGDLFRDHEISGVKKAVWIFFLIFVPFLTALLYLVVRGDGMGERAIAERQRVQAAFEQMVGEAAVKGSADELEKLAKLKNDGTITEAEFETAKAKLLA